MVRPMGLGKKAPNYSDPCMPWLMKLSKAALADCVVDLLRANANIDNAVSQAEAIERLTPVLYFRGDKIPS